MCGQVPPYKVKPRRFVGYLNGDRPGALYIHVGDMHMYICVVGEPIFMLSEYYRVEEPVTTDISYGPFQTKVINNTTKQK